MNVKTVVYRWGPALLWMAIIFLSSATPSRELPRFGSLDVVVKKGGHMLGYAILALAYRRGLGWKMNRSPAAWALAVLYALLDEFHQSFVPGRHPSLVDALLFDAGGAALALWLGWALSRIRRSSTIDHTTGTTRN
jgi:hypothetical protein